MFKLVVLLAVLGMTAAKPGVALAYSSVLPAVSSQSQYSSSVVHGLPYLAPSVYGTGVVAGPALYPGYATLAQAPHSPAVVLDANRGVPLDTPEVIAARAAHYQAKALSLHHLKKRSAPLHYSATQLVSPFAYSSPVLSAYRSPVVSSYPAPVVSAYSSPLISAYSSPLAYHGVVPKALSVHPW